MHTDPLLGAAGSSPAEAGGTIAPPAFFLGQSIFLLCSGPSLLIAPLDRLAGRVVATVNRTVETYMSADCAVIRDKRVMGNLAARGVLDDYAGMVVRLSIADRSTNAGLGALLWVLRGGPQKVYIAGLDLGTETRMQQWHHDGYPWSPHESHAYRRFIKSFEAVDTGAVPVFNLNPDSAVKRFPSCTWEEALAQTAQSCTERGRNSILPASDSFDG